MAHMSLNQYLQQVDSAWRNREGNLLGEFLSFRHGHVISSRLHIENPDSAVERVIDPPLDEIVAAHLRCVYSATNQEYVEAYRWQTQAVQAACKALQAQRDENWLLPMLLALCLDLRLLALSADRERAKRGQGPPRETLEKAADCLMSCFRICAADNRSSEEDTKRWGMLSLVNQLFKVYFHINKLHLCRPLIRAIESTPLKEHFSLSQQVTYRYYVGRKAMFDSDYVQADEYLSYAFQRCHRQCARNKRQILIYLIPVKVLLGYMPSRRVLEKYDLLQLWDVVEAVKAGDIGRLNAAVQLHEAFFIKCGIYLLLEKLKIVTYRNLFKKVHLILNTHQIPVDAFVCALRCVSDKNKSGKEEQGACGVILGQVDADEVECIIANLIFEGKIKGYISRQHQKVVVSKSNAFPPLNSISGA
ncbi:PCI domain-containing protein 2 [Ischnura elegans]|uniref:PCI domain-containing protein 2 n=1 Tax=Ischnura elegans TaxID=197161 RepID=UPI001ED873F5|nr:PCI domain-containing protein 2 [Ischnura elegans]